MHEKLALDLIQALDHMKDACRKYLEVHVHVMRELHGEEGLTINCLEAKLIQKLLVDTFQHLDVPPALSLVGMAGLVHAIADQEANEGKAANKRDIDDVISDLESMLKKEN